MYNLLNEHIKQKIAIHPAGEWLLDNFYIIEEVTKSIEKELTLEKYTKFVGIANGKYQGFARIYVLSAEIVNYTDNKITREILENGITAYQTKKKEFKYGRNMEYRTISLDSNYRKYKANM